MTRPDREIIIIGGGPAGLSAALTLARARRSVSIIDNGEPRNAPAVAAHGLLGLEGINPLEFLARGRDEVASFGGETVHGKVVAVSPEPDRFAVHLADGNALTAGTLLIATGVTDEFPPIAGLRERWGRDVIHCPYCHGWEIRDQRIGLIATGPMSALQALQFRQWSNQVTFFPQGLDYSQGDLQKLAAVDIPVVTQEVVGIELDADRLAGLRLGDGSVVRVDAAVVPTRTVVRTEGLDELGLETVTSPAGTALAADAAGRTNVVGVWAAGSTVNAAMQVSEAAASGARVAMTINSDLILRDAELAAGCPEGDRS